MFAPLIIWAVEGLVTKSVHSSLIDFATPEFWFFLLKKHQNSLQILTHAKQLACSGPLRFACVPGGNRTPINSFEGCYFIR